MTVQGKQPRHVSYKMSVAFPRYHRGQRSHEVNELICGRQDITVDRDLMKLMNSFVQGGFALSLKLHKHSTLMKLQVVFLTVLRSWNHHCLCFSTELSFLLSSFLSVHHWSSHHTFILLVRVPINSLIIDANQALSDFAAHPLPQPQASFLHFTSSTPNPYSLNTQCIMISF